MTWPISSGGPLPSACSIFTEGISPKPSLMGARIAPREPRGYRDVFPGPRGRNRPELLGPGLEETQEGVGGEDPGQGEAANPARHRARTPVAFGRVAIRSEARRTVEPRTGAEPHAAQR